MNSANPNLGKEAIDNRFIRAVIALMDTGIATTQGEIAQALGVKSAKFSEIMNGRMHVGVDMLSELSDVVAIIYLSQQSASSKQELHFFPDPSFPPALL